MLAWRMLPNALTVLRMILVPPLVWLLLSGRHEAALAVALVAGISDALDGALARGFGWQTRFGGIADPLADKLLLVAAFLTLAWLGVLPAWLVGLVVLRDVVIVAGALVYHLRFGSVPASPTLLSKCNTGVQLLLVWAALLRLAEVPVPIRIVDGLVIGVAVLAVATLVQYVVVWSLRAARVARERAGS
ncbi:MAG: CDP-alcohol phosphatidyltransferase family protein [Wenzhouxiangellaceae bacterium]|nr:CDP-alcohol phosphatidyltransferase family protein [Wenzhouxiangellaceae bacterium]